MNEFSVHVLNGKGDGERVSIGPDFGPDALSLTIPLELKRRVTYSSNPLTVMLHCAFEDDKLQLVKVEIQNFDGYVSTRDLLQLKLPAVMRQIALSSVSGADEFMANTKLVMNTPSSLKSNLGLLAQLYWFEAVTWGAPRKSIMEISGCSRSTANEYITLASKLFPLPKERAEAFDPTKTRKIGPESWLIPDPEAQD